MSTATREIEADGLVVPLSMQVMGMACEEAQGWAPPSGAPVPLTIAVNLSARQFEPGDLTTTVRTSLEQTGLDPTCLHLELTETAIIDLRPDIVRQLELIRESDERIVPAVVDLAANLGLRSIAEGVETIDQLTRLRELDCDQGQGYLFARPLPPNDVSMDLLNSAW
jgi:EAL domain-containing protein (putative c-di-GMP-specific phosphodiesterase class I)